MLVYNTSQVQDVAGLKLGATIHNKLQATLYITLKSSPHVFNRPRLVYLVEYGHEEGGGLAGAGLRARHHVALPQHYGDRVLLHRRRLVVACVRYVRAHYFRQVNVLELYVTNEKNINK